VQGFSRVDNYGCDRVGLPAPVRVGAQVRATATVDEVRAIDGGVQAGVTLTFETDGGGKPVCVAAILVRYYV
jgi:acyl dehydratase